MERYSKPSALTPRKTLSRQFAPDETHCAICGAALHIQYTKKRARIYGLQADYSCKLIYRVCKNPTCLGRYQMSSQGEKQLKVYASKEFNRFAVPRHRLTWQLLNEIGRLRFEERLSLGSIRQVLVQEYHLDVALQRLSDWVVLYEAACLAWWNSHPIQIKKALNQLTERVYLIDYTEDTTKQPVLRVFVAGLGLGLITRVVDKPKADAIAPLLKELDHLYGAPDLIVCDDDETIKNACRAIWSHVPIQDCFEHLLRNLTDTLLDKPRKLAQSVLRRATYRKTLEDLRIHLLKDHPLPWPEHGEDLRELLELLLFKPSGGDHTRPPALQKLQLFEDVWTHLNYLFKAIQGQLLPPDRMFPELEVWRERKAKLPADQAFQGLQDERLLVDPFYRGLLRVKKMVDSIHQDPQTSQALKAWKSGRDALDRLRCTHWALKSHQLKKNKRLVKD